MKNYFISKDETFEVKIVDVYDTFQDDSHFHRLMKAEINDGDLVFMASYDEMANA
jgi:hypothetical protein